MTGQYRSDLAVVQGRTCKVCSQGAYQNEVGGIMCKACPAGYRVGECGINGKYKMLKVINTKINGKKQNLSFQRCHFCSSFYVSLLTRFFFILSDFFVNSITQTFTLFFRFIIFCKTILDATANLGWESTEVPHGGCTSCEQCSSGQFQVNTGENVCSRCPSGKHGTASNTIRDSESNGCTTCPNGRWTGTNGGNNGKYFL